MQDKGSALVQSAAGRLKKQAKKSIKPAAKKQAAKHAAKSVKHAAKKAKHAAEKTSQPRSASASDSGLVTAFHHMQRASAVISLMEKGTGEDLRDLLERGVKLYRKATEGKAGSKSVLRAIGVLRAAEHLSLAGLYEAREKHRQRVASPPPEWLQRLLPEIEHRLEQIEHAERGKGTDLFPASVELLRQAESADHDAHMAFELAMAADALCFALENGL